MARKPRLGRKERLAEKQAKARQYKATDGQQLDPATLRLLGFRPALTISADAHELTSKSHYSGCSGAHSQGTGQGGEKGRLKSKKWRNKRVGVKQRFSEQEKGVKAKPYSLINVTWHVIPSHVVPLKDKVTGEARLIRVPAKSVPRGLKR